VNEVAELVVPLDGGGWTAHDTKLLLGRLGRCEIQRAVRPMGVVVADEDAEHALEVAPVDVRSQSRHSPRTVRTKRSAIAFAFGARIGVLTILMPSLAKTASKARVNLLSRSRTRNRNDPGRSWRAQANLRACRVTQAPVGFAVQPAKWTRRLPSSMKKRT
jgi:hypothetical protein